MMKYQKHIPSFLKKKINSPNEFDRNNNNPFDETKSKKSFNSEQRKIVNDQKMIKKLKHQSDFLEKEPYQNNLKTYAQTLKNNYVSSQGNNNDGVN